ncbi:MAG: SUMF1/EgtB/PvdO family nonheme iron enzyme [Pseudomonadota bacterium]
MQAIVQAALARTVCTLMLLCVGYLAPLTANAAQGERVALLIGNATYSAGPLRNPPADVRAMEAALRAVGFKVETVMNANQNQMKRAVRDFGERAQGVDIAFLYYSGHGTQANGENYLIPIHADIKKESDYEVEAVSANALMRQIAGARPKAAIVVLDACRDNPYASSTRGGSKGLGRMDAPTGTMIAFATAPNTTASDEGFYARVLAAQIKTPGVELLDVFRNTTAEVRRLSGNKQEPRVSEVSITDRIYLAGSASRPVLLASIKPEPVPRTAQGDADEIETQSWMAVEQDNSMAAYEAYLEQYPKGKHAAAARSAMAQLNADQTKQTEDSAWRDAQAANTTAAYDAYIGTYPQGKHAGAAKIKLATLKEAQKRAALAVTPTQAGSSFRDCPDCPEMVWLPPGNFTMGSNDDDREKPIHGVQINYKLAVGKFSVTRGQFARFVQESGHDAGNSCWIFADRKWADTAGRNWRNSGYSQGDDHPVACVNWDDAQAFVKWLRTKTGKAYRLLSESEYEYAARAGTTSKYYWGDTASHEYANYDGVEGRDQWLNTSPVGSFDANRFGLYDMLGNVWSWTEDCWNENYSGAPTDGSVWNGGACARRVLRGGSWFITPQNLRAADRNRGTSATRFGGIGFRLARTAP